MLFATAVAAQTAPPASSGASDNWASHPAAASSSGYRSHASRETAPTKEHFKFKQREPTGPMNQPPPSANDKAAAMGTDRPWQDGRPPVDCAQSPMDSACHH